MQSIRLCFSDALCRSAVELGVAGLLILCSAAAAIAGSTLLLLYLQARRRRRLAWDAAPTASAVAPNRPSREAVPQHVPPERLDRSRLRPPPAGQVRRAA